MHLKFNIDIIFTVRIIAVLLTLILFFSVQSSARIRITEPSIAPATPPEIEGNEEILAPPPAPAPEFKTYVKEPGIFHLDQKAELTGSYLFENWLAGTFSAGADLIIGDSNHLGEKIGLAEDALEYKVGLGLALGYDAGNQPIFSVPLHAGASLYFKEGSLYGFDPFAGIGVNLNIIGTDFRFGGIGYQLFGGILVDLGLSGEKTGIALGYNRLNVEGSRLAQGYCVFATQPVKF